MPFELDEKQVLVWAVGKWKRFNPGQIHLGGLERDHSIGQRSGFVLKLKHQRRFVISGRFVFGVSNYREPSDILLVVFNVFVDHIEPMMNPSFAGGDSRHSTLLSRSRCSRSRAGNFDLLYVRQTLCQLMPTLRKRLRLTMNFLNFRPRTHPQ